MNEGVQLLRRKAEEGSMEEEAMEEEEERPKGKKRRLNACVIVGVITFAVGCKFPFKIT